jgi:site-specific DNA recombinase
LNYLWTRAINNIPAIFSRIALEKGVFILERKTVEVLWPEEKEVPVKESNEKLRVAAYCRISKIADDMKTSSLENQMDYYSKYILQHPGYKLVGIYYDRGISGLTIDKRPGFKRLIRHCLEHRIDIIITKSISRFSRNAKDLLETVELLREHNVTVLFEKENIDTSKTKNKFFLTALAAVYQQEALTISEHVKWGLEKKNKMGKPVFVNQYGYRVIEIDGDKTFRIVDEEAKVIKLIYEHFLLGNSTQQIALHLTEYGIKSPSGKDIWLGTSVKNILTNFNLTGNRCTNKVLSVFFEKKCVINEGQENRYLIKNTHPPIIDENTFYEVQAIIDGKKKKKKKGPNATYPLSKRITCGYCGWYFHRIKMRKTIKWRCGLNNKISKCCNSTSFDESILQKMMIKAVSYRYDFEQPGALKRMKDDLKRVNQNDRFELHRMSHLMGLILAKEELAQADTNKQEEMKKKVDELETHIVAFEELASKIEEDRAFRVASLEKLKGIETIEEFIEKADIAMLRAWIMGLSLLTEEDFQVQWLDNAVTEIGNFIQYYDKKNIVLSNSKKKKAGIEIEQEIKINPTISKRIEHNPKMINSKEGGNENVGVVEIKNKSPNELIYKIKKKFKDNTQGIVKIEPVKKIKKTRVGVYARVSTREPDQLGSLEAQVAYYTFALLKDSNSQLIRIYADEGVSGTNAQRRPGFQKMIRDCENRKIDRIVTKSISRFARNSVDALEYVRKLKEYKVSIYFEKEQIDTANEDGEVLLTVYSALAQEESRSLGEGISWGKKAYAKRGVVGHSVRTYGYDFNKDRSWHIVEDEAKVVKSIFERCIAGTSAVQISRDLTSEAIPTMKKKASWNHKTIIGILNNPTYTGELLYQKRFTQDTLTNRIKLNFGESSQVLIEDHHPAIIDRNTWDRAQIALEKRRPKKSDKTRSMPHDKKEFFSRFICSECGCFYFHIALKNKAGTRHRWKCKAALKKHSLISCDTVHIEEEDIMKLFMTMLLDFKRDKSFEGLLNKTIENKKLTLKEKQRLAYLEEENQKKYLELYKVVEEGGKSGEDTAEIKRHTDSIMAIQNQINEILDKEDAYNFFIREKNWFLKELDNLDDKKPSPYRGDIFKRIINDAIVHPNNIITFNLSFGISKTASK